MWNSSHLDFKYSIHITSIECVHIRNHESGYYAHRPQTTHMRNATKSMVSNLSRTPCTIRNDFCCRTLLLVLVNVFLTVLFHLSTLCSFCVPVPYTAYTVPQHCAISYIDERDYYYYSYYSCYFSFSYIRMKLNVRKARAHYGKRSHISSHSSWIYGKYYCLFCCVQIRIIRWNIKSNWRHHFLPKST